MLRTTKNAIKLIASACPTLEAFGSIGAAIICLPLSERLEDRVQIVQIGWQATRLQNSGEITNARLGTRRALPYYGFVSDTGPALSPLRVISGHCRRASECRFTPESGHR